MSQPIRTSLLADIGESTDESDTLIPLSEECPFFYGETSYPDFSAEDADSDAE
jgi:hypothetical protein